VGKLSRLKGAIDNVGRKLDDAAQMAARQADDAAQMAARQADELDMSHAARMARAREQGYTTDLYHGTNQKFDAFDLSESGHADAVWLTDAEWYARMMADHRSKKGEYGAPEVMALRAKIQNPKTIDILEEGRRVADEIGVDLPQTSMQAQELLSGGMGWDSVVGDMVNEAKAQGYDALVLKSFNDRQSIDTTATLVFDPVNLRSANAAFDPANIGKNDLMGSIDPRLLAPIAAASGGALVAGRQFTAEDYGLPQEIYGAYEQFAQRRAAKRSIWQKLREAGEFGATVGSALAGGIVSDLSRVGGYLNPFMPVEQTEAGASAIQDAMQYMPRQPNAMLEGFGNQMGQFMQDIEPIAAPFRQSIPYKAYEALPERAQGIVRVATDFAL
jgi:hypothetical protein